MRIHGLCTCVNYAQFLRATGPLWTRGLSSLTIVTSPDDKETRLETQALSKNPGAPCSVNLYLTHAFYENGASFNKGLAMEQARHIMPWEDWILFFDIDIMPAITWGDFRSYPDVLSRTMMYGARRYQAPMPAPGEVPLTHGGVQRVNDDRVGYGYFQLFHSTHPNVQKRPLLDTCWKHAGNYDSNFLLSWGDAVYDLSPMLPLFHIGPKHENWYGVGKEEEFRKMQETRGGHGIHPSEKIEPYLL